MVVIEMLSEGGEVLVAVPFRQVGFLELLLGLEVKGTPCRVEVVEVLEGGGVVVGGVWIFELGVELLVDCVTKVGSGSLEETLANVPACLHAFPLFFLAFLRMCGSGVVNGGVVAVRINLFDVCGDAGLMVVFVDT